MDRLAGRVEDLPVLGVCGLSGSGKTTLLEGFLGRQRGGDLAIAVVKHDVHGIDVDRRGKDSDRLYRAGADLFLWGPGEGLVRWHGADAKDLDYALTTLCARYDLVLVEGHKSSPLPKVWLLGPDERAPPEDLEEVIAVLPWDSDRVEAFTGMVQPWLEAKCRRAPVLGGVLIGGQSQRMGQPKHLLRRDGETWVARAVSVLRQATREVVILGAGEVPYEMPPHLRLPDVPGLRGPMAGVLSALRWAPTASWLIAPCDTPDLCAEALAWLLDTRAPGVWASLPRLQEGGPVEPLVALYDCRARALIEPAAAARDFSLASLAHRPQVRTPVIPQHLAAAWRNVNAPADLEP